MTEIARARCMMTFLLVLAGAMPGLAQVARVASVQGTTQVRSGGGSFHAVGAGTALNAGDTVRTGRRAKADIRFRDGSLVRLGQLSALEFPNGNDVRLVSGQLLFSALRPGRILARSAAAEIKGSVGVISIDRKDEVNFALYSGIMEVVTPTQRANVPPGHQVSASGNKLSVLNLATSLLLAGISSGSSLVDPPVDAPFAGSNLNAGVRAAPDRIAAEQLQQTLALEAAPFVPGATPVPPFPIPFPTEPPGKAAPSSAPTARSMAADNVSGATDLPVPPGDPGAAFGMTGGVTGPEVDQLSIDLSHAYAHINDSSVGSSQGAGGDVRLLGFVGDGGTRAGGGFLSAYGNQGRLFLNVGLLGLRVHSHDANGRAHSSDLSSISDALLTYRDRRGDLRLGRQRFLEGPMQVALFGSLVRQGGREVMDAVRVTPRLGAHASLDVAYLYDAFPRNLPYKVPGHQSGFYARLATSTRYLNAGVNLLRYNNSDVHGTTGVTLDFAIPIIRNQIEFYGEFGRDSFRRRLTGLGLAFPGLYNRTGFDVFLEYGRLHESALAAGPPTEIALRIYRRLNDNLDLVGSWRHLSDDNSDFLLGVSAGAHFDDAR